MEWNDCHCNIRKMDSFFCFFLCALFNFSFCNVELLLCASELAHQQRTTTKKLTAIQRSERKKTFIQFLHSFSKCVRFWMTWHGLIWNGYLASIGMQICVKTGNKIYMFAMHSAQSIGVDDHPFVRSFGCSFEVSREVCRMRYKRSIYLWFQEI